MDARICPSCGEKNNPQFTSCWKCHAVLQPAEGVFALKPSDTVIRSSDGAPKKRKDSLSGAWGLLILSGFGFFLSLYGEYHRDIGLDAFFKDPFYSYSRFAAACIHLIGINLLSIIAFVIGAVHWRKNEIEKKRGEGKLIVIISLVLIFLSCVRMSLPSSWGNFEPYFRGKYHESNLAPT